MARQSYNNLPDASQGHLRMPKVSNEPLRDGSPVAAERAVLVGILLPNTRADLRDPLGELAALAESAGADVVDSLIQKRTELTAKFGLGKGKVQEVAERAAAHDAEVIIFDIDLTPRQIRSLERELQVKVIDRSELILDIFASRAKTREAQLQVELAQLQYTAPRLRGMWTHLERIAGAGGGTSAGAVGGVGTRGPGERQIEIDRRIVKDRITLLKREIEEIDKRKRQEVKSRGDEFTVSLVGYTNSGKTTLMNRLTDAKQFSADMLFATLDTKTVRWEVGEGRQVLLSDTVGFVRDLPHHLVASFRATLEETLHADLLLHVVDASSSMAHVQVEAVDEVLRSLGCTLDNEVLLLNKMDVAENPDLPAMLKMRKPDSLEISARRGDGIDTLLALVTRRMLGTSVDATLLVPHAAGKVLAEIDRRAEVFDRRYNNEGVEMDVRMNRTQLAQLLGRHEELTLLAGEVRPPTLEETFFGEDFSSEASPSEHASGEEGSRNQ